MTGVSVKDRLRQKLESGEITEDEYEELYHKFMTLDLLDAVTPPKKKRRVSWSFTGSKIVDESAKVNGPVNVTGSLVVNGDLESKKLNVAGSAAVAGNLTVVEKASVAGRLDVKGSSTIGGSVVIAGKANFGSGVLVTSAMKVAGRCIVADELVVGEGVRIGGFLSTTSLKCPGKIKLDGTLQTSGDVVCEKLTAPLGTKSMIGGDIRAQDVVIGAEQSTINIEVEGLEGLPTLVEKIIKQVGGIRGKMEVNGSIVAERKVVIHNCVVHGDVRAPKVRIGDGVSVAGKIYYTKSVRCPDELQPQCVKIEE